LNPIERTTISDICPWSVRCRFAHCSVLWQSQSLPILMIDFIWKH